MRKIKSLQAVLATQSRPRASGPAMQRGVREGCIAALRRALQGQLLGRSEALRWMRAVAPISRSGARDQGAPTTFMEA